ncbi:MAG: PspC domain-containing protein [Candidatus Paceibacterota bacterium]|jgi:phage shock protein PspC (stress-responsive transcriptional regulator)
MSNTKKLYRSKTDRVIFGICGGLGEYFEVDPLILRILFILLTFTGGSGIVIYLILAVLIPSGEGKKVKGKEVKEVISEVQGKTQDLAEEIKKGGSWIKSAKNIIGLVIILMGLNVLFDQVFDINLFSFICWEVVVPIIVIVIGVIIIVSNKK